MLRHFSLLPKFGEIMCLRVGAGASRTNAETGGAIRTNVAINWTPTQINQLGYHETLDGLLGKLGNTFLY